MDPAFRGRGFWGAMMILSIINNQLKGGPDESYNIRGRFGKKIFHIHGVDKEGHVEFF